MVTSSVSADGQAAGFRAPPRRKEAPLPKPAGRLDTGLSRLREPVSGY